MKRFLINITLLFIGMVIVITSSLAKDSTGITSKIGDKLPPINWTGVLNVKDGKLSTEDLQGKLVIFDIWNVYCGSCIVAMPELEKLQEKFGDEIQIVLVTNSTQEQVDKLFERSAVARNVKLPSIIGDTVLTRLFEYRTVPAHLWIDKNGIITHFTNGSNTSERNIEKFLRNSEVDLPYKKEYVDFDIYASLLTEGDGRQLKHIKYYTLISEKIDDDGGGAGPIYDEDTKRILPWKKKWVNEKIINLYKNAFYKEFLYTNGFPIPDQLIELRVSDISRFYRPEKEDEIDRWNKSNLFCYEISVPESKIDQIPHIMRRDLDLYFDLKSSLEKKNTNCIILKKINPQIPFKSNYEKREVKIEKNYFYITNQWFSTALDQLGLQLSRNFKAVLINETGEMGNARIDLILKGELESLESINQQLKEFNLFLSKEKRNVPHLILEE